MTRIFKEKSLYTWHVSAIYVNLYEIIPTKYTWSFNCLMTNTKFASLKNIVDVSLYSYHMQVMGENHVGISIPFQSF